MTGAATPFGAGTGLEHIEPRNRVLQHLECGFSQHLGDSKGRRTDDQGDEQADQRGFEKHGGPCR